ncbi:DUF4335 domain-containing protein [Roseofilum casamattae]|uniref:DUF4335 domain-containing protein n=1 Tax=Roseofilum casamattae BLCC-M143 TaxID=3022442 RepID=A0ABT7BXI3_9CYAN|nr:DUF4335 domain-containing protein [Roseofilum casamattae]MDJ1183244.1 DUF4335 domain-containing protein [Roseofilum casamattae BLCC-M143]
MASSVIRRYTPPTCTLEILARSSPLSRWMKQTAIKDLKFRLRFDDPRSKSESPVTVNGDRIQLETLCDTVTVYVQNFLANTPELVDNSISLEPQGLTRHCLNLSSLVPDDSELSVVLSALQLFDLAAALEQYTMDLVTLPDTTPVAKPKPTPMYGWRFAASFFISMGITATSVVWLKDFYPQPQATLETASSNVGEEVYDNPSVAQTPETPAALAEEEKLSGDAEVETFTSDEQLPPPPPPGAIAPETPPESPSDITSAPESVAIPAAPSIPPPTITEPEPAVISPPPVLLEPPPELAIVPETPDIAETEDFALESLDAASAELPDLPPAAAPAELPDLPPAAVPELPPTELDEVLPSTAARSASPPAAIASGNLFEGIPQVAEVRSYFEGRWEPPDSLSKTVEYKLTLNSDGTLQAISPLGETAATYLDRTGMPLLGDPFVSPSSGSPLPPIRVVFSPDGTVQAFPQAE